ncbi:MAG: aminotransferase class I/II-fold pyridoxal phosphate-dependent enzyme, partial [Thermoleophilia bacterium]|nr:aminotransferase class I/II-fold pyridoxal phosphate-dependent enzyme [Thermoleophilia bacterium]
MIDLAAERVIRHIESLPDQPGEDVEGAKELSRSLIEDLPESGRPFPELLELLFERVAPKSLNTMSPGFMSYIPGGGLFHAAVADLMGNVINRYVTVWQAAPGLATLEANVIRWFGGMVGYPSEATGFLASGGSMANLSALVTARKDRLPEDFLRGTIYMSDQTHHSITKAALIAGFPERSVRTVPVDSLYRIRIDALQESIRRDRAVGLQPFLIVGSAGTTNTGAVDDLDALADVARDEEMWLHHDAAYGGFFMLTERGREAMRGIGRADSITLDPHKGLFLPYGTGCLLARDRAALERAHRVDADYMPRRESSDEIPSFCDISPELSRDFRGLRVWLPMKTS